MKSRLVKSFQIGFFQNRLTFDVSKKLTSKNLVWLKVVPLMKDMRLHVLQKLSNMVMRQRSIIKSFHFLSKKTFCVKFLQKHWKQKYFTSNLLVKEVIKSSNVQGFVNSCKNIRTW